MPLGAIIATLGAIAADVINIVHKKMSKCPRQMPEIMSSAQGVSSGKAVAGPLNPTKKMQGRAEKKVEFKVIFCTDLYGSIARSF